jgi:hypothetical protein
LVGVLSAISLLAMTSAPGGNVVELKAQVVAAEVGEVYAVQVLASAAVPVNAVSIEVKFPSNYVDVFGVDRGQSVITLWAEEPEIKSSSVTLSGGTFRRGFIGTHEIATINFRAKEAGQFTIQLGDVQFVSGDGSGTEISTSDSPRATLSMFQYDENMSPEELDLIITKRVAGDLTGDGRVTLQDISAFMATWHNQSEVIDLSGDGNMTFRDFSILLAEYFRN